MSTALPSPDALTAAHSARTADALRATIATAGGAIPFGQYMHEALYAPGLGYYAAGTQKFAAGGDFTTAPELSPVFAQVLAMQCQQTLDELDGGDIIELGAGSGALAADLLSFLDAHSALPDRYWIIEISAELTLRQRTRIAEQCPQLLSRVEWVSDPAGLSTEGIVIANEVLDALPVERFRVGREGLTQQFVAVEDGRLMSVWRPATPAVADAVAVLQESLETTFAPGFESEVCLATASWCDVCAGMLSRGVVLLSDYGYGRRDYYAPDRNTGTLMCHYQHHAHSDPFWLPGAQDITAWVDFTTVATALDGAGMDYLGFTTQAQFLLHGGMTTLVDATPPDPAQAAALRTLLLPGEMGERFRFIGFGKAIKPRLSGFEGRDFGMQL
ncbi:MAG: SAM-dependent methyltransferase [Pseudomonadota bacterium]